MSNNIEMSCEAASYLLGLGHPEIIASYVLNNSLSLRFLLNT